MLIFEPGIHRGVSMDEYNELPYLRASGVKEMQVSVADFWAKYIDPERERESTNALDFGTAFHAMLLEPEVFAETYGIKPEGMSFSTKEGKAWQAENGDRHIIKYENLFLMERMRRNIDYCGVAKFLRDGEAEVTLIWDEESRHGPVRCKARVDWLSDDFAIDIKTFSNSMRKPVRTCIAHEFAKYRYHVSGAFYQRGFKALGLDRRSLFIFVESNGVPNVAVRECGPEGFGGINQYWLAAQSQVSRAAEIYAECSKEYAPGMPWVNKQEPEMFEDADFPLYLINEE